MAVSGSPQRGFLPRWVAVTTIAELLGFAVPAASGVATAAAAPALQLGALLAAGLFEGALLGLGQALVLRRALPVSVPRWSALTALAASVAYLMGMAPSTWASGLLEAPPLVQVPVWGLLALALLASIGTAQWLELRRHLPSAAHWIWITAVSWLAGLTVFLVVAPPLWEEGQSFGLLLAIGLLAGLLMAACVALVSGLGMRWLLRRRSPSSA